ncbi:MAG: hypothetical protein HY547_00695 [Elusimicrobia bacterium]|nr:hypothetical protein [Elusimicrobiota bacterium]
MAEPIPPKAPPMPPARLSSPPGLLQRLPLPPRAFVPPGALPPKREPPTPSSSTPREPQNEPAGLGAELAGLKEQFRYLESKTQETTAKNVDLERQKVSLEEKIGRLEKLLLEEREKVALTGLRAQEEKSVGLRVETSLREIQEKLRRDQRERELELNRSKLENQIKDMEKKIVHERETWVEALKGQMAKRDLEDRAVEERMNAKIRETDQRFQQERSRFGAKMEEKNKELEELRRALVVKEEAARDAALRVQELTRVLQERESRLSDLERDLGAMPRLREEAQTSALERQQLLQDVKTISEDLRQAKKSFDESQDALKKRDAWMLRARAAMAAITKKSREQGAVAHELKFLKTRYGALVEMTRRVQRERSEAEAGFQQKISQAKTETELARQQQWSIEQERLKALAEAERFKLEKQLQERHLRELEEQVIRLRHEMELSGKSNLELPGVLRQLEAARKEADAKSMAALAFEEDLRQAKNLCSEYAAQRDDLSRQLQSLREQMVSAREQIKGLSQETSKTQELAAQLNDLKNERDEARRQMLLKDRELVKLEGEMASGRQSAQAELEQMQGRAQGEIALSRERAEEASKSVSELKDQLESMRRDVERWRVRGIEAESSRQNQMKRHEDDRQAAAATCRQLQEENLRLQDRCERLEGRLKEGVAAGAKDVHFLEGIKQDLEGERQLSQRLLNEVAFLKERAAALEAAQQTQRESEGAGASQRWPAMEEDLARLKESQKALEATLAEERAGFQEKLNEAHKILEYQCIAYEEKLRDAFERLGKKVQEEPKAQEPAKKEPLEGRMPSRSVLRELASWLSKPVS